ncbi:phage holin family protein [Candidatus Beckwithbacteria bacterium]|nr:phage holin family protein [Candidatus Beckwithbacteria bacterium]
MKVILKTVANALAILITAYIINPNMIRDFKTALITAFVLGIINTFIRPIISLITLPINILTLGLFTFIINAVIILFVSNLVVGFYLDGFLNALVFSLVYSFLSSILSSLVK